MKPTEKSLFEYLYEYAKSEGDNLLFFNERTSYTVKETYDTVRALVCFLSENGIRSGDYVSLCCTRTLDTALLFFTLQSMGVVGVLCDPHFSTEEFLKNSGVDVSVKASIDFQGGKWILKKGESTLSFNINKQASCVSFESKVDVKAPAIIVFTSGSTGLHKGVVLSQYNYLNYVVNYKPNGNYSLDDISPEVLPLHHVFGLAVILTGLVNRYKVFFPEAVNPDYIGECIEKYKLTRLDGVPSFAYALANAKIAKGYNTDSLRVGVLGGAPSSKEQFYFIQNTLGLKLLPAYGQSECLVISGSSKEVSDEDRATSVGKFLQMSRGYILDSYGKELPVGEEGEVCVKAPEVMLGYHNNPEDTAAAIDSEGRLHTGDLGFVDEKGFLHITGRIKDIIIRNGNNLSTAQIESKLLSLPFIAQASVVGVQDETCGEIPVAIVVLKQGQVYDEGAVKAALTKIELPRTVKVQESIPLTSSGKPDKQKIKELFR